MKSLMVMLPSLHPLQATRQSLDDLAQTDEPLIVREGKLNEPSLNRADCGWHHRLSLATLIRFQERFGACSAGTLLRKRRTLRFRLSRNTLAGLCVAPRRRRIRTAPNRAAMPQQSAEDRRQE